MSPTAPRTAKILLLDDQEANLLLLERVLRHGGYADTRSVADPRRAVAAFLEFQPDLVLLDLTMPHLDGVAVIELLRPLAAGTHLPIVMLTADVSPEARQRALAAGATDFLTKPFDATEVLLRLRNLLETRSLYLELQRRAEQDVRTARQRLEHVISSSPAVLYTLGFAGGRISGISWISENIRELLGYAPGAAVEPDWWLANIHPEDRDRVIAQTHADLSARGRAAHEYRFRHADGGYRWTRGELRLIRDAAGVPVEVVGSWADITERKGLEEQFRQSQKMEAVGRLAGGVAHDFNNLLTVIIGFSEVAMEDLPPGAAALEMIREVRAAGTRAASLTRQLLAFSRKQMLAPAVLDLNALVGETERMLRRLIGADVTLTTRLDPALWRVKADPGQLEQVLMNLVVNARDAMPTGGRLAIETRNLAADPGGAARPDKALPPPCVQLTVTDTGCGMDEATKARLFEPFFTTKEEGKGTGLGLATVHGIVTQSGGTIEVESEPGRGTTFAIRLPRLTEAAAKANGAGPEAGVLPRGTGTVLLVEDEERVRSLTSLALRSAGYTVTEAGDGEHALAVAREHEGPIDMLVTDVVMPRMNGRQLADRMTALYPGLKVLFMSGYTDDTVLRHGIRETGVAFVQKPFTPAALARKVREVLGH